MGYKPFENGTDPKNRGWLMIYVPGFLCQLPVVLGAPVVVVTTIEIMPRSWDIIPVNKYDWDTIPIIPID